MKSFNEVFALAKGKSAVVAVAVAHDEYVLDAVRDAINEKLARFILVGDAEKIKSIAANLGMDLSGQEVINEVDPAAACKVAVSKVAAGEAAAVMKGLVDTSVIMRAVLDKETGLRTGSKLSHVGAFAVPTYHKLLFITDAAVNVAPDFDTKVSILKNTIEACHKLGMENPKVALLAAKEKVDEKMPVTVECGELKKMNESGELPGAIMEGPYALDVAISKEGAHHKGVEGQVPGDPDILFVPDIEAGNILYKALTTLANAKTGGVVLGAKAPVILTSRSDDSQSKLNAIALGLAMA